MRAPLRVSLGAAVCMCVLLTVQARAAAPLAPAGAAAAPVMAIERFVNTRAAIPAGTYAPGAVISDEFAPFHWATGDVGGQWSAGFIAYNASIKLTAWRIVLAMPSEYATARGRYYVVYPARFTGRLNGKPYVETGYWTFVVIQQRSGTWAVQSQTWAGVTFK